MQEDLALSVVIPAFDEEARLPPTLDILHEWLSASGSAFEIVVVDDGSTDRTCDLVERRIASNPELRLLRTGSNRGKGHAVRSGMLAARGAVRVMFDADGSTPPRELPKVVSPVADGHAAIAIGSRYVDGAAPHGQPWWRRVWSRTCNAWVRRFLIPGIYDPYCGFKAFSAAAALDVFSQSHIDGWGADLEVLALAQRGGHLVVEVGVDWQHDGRSRIRPGRDVFRVLAETRALRRRLDDEGADAHRR